MHEDGIHSFSDLPQTPCQPPVDIFNFQSGNTLTTPILLLNRNSTSREKAMNQKKKNELSQKLEEQGQYASIFRNNIPLKLNVIQDEQIHSRKQSSQLDYTEDSIENTARNKINTVVDCDDVISKVQINKDLELNELNNNLKDNNSFDQKKTSVKSIKHGSELPEKVIEGIEMTQIRQINDLDGFTGLSDEVLKQQSITEKLLQNQLKQQQQSQNQENKQEKLEKPQQQHQQYLSPQKNSPQRHAAIFEIEGDLSNKYKLNSNNIPNNNINTNNKDRSLDSQLSIDLDINEYNNNKNDGNIVKSTAVLDAPQQYDSFHVRMSALDRHSILMNGANNLRNQQEKSVSEIKIAKDVFTDMRINPLFQNNSSSSSVKNNTLSIIRLVHLKNLIHRLVTRFFYQNNRFRNLTDYQISLIGDITFLSQSNLNSQQAQKIKETWANFLERLLKIRTFNPLNRWKMIWDIFIASIMVFFFVTTPIILSTQRELNSLFGEFPYFILCIGLIIDCFINANTGYYRNGCLIKSKYEIISAYSKNLLIFDLLSIIPLVLYFSQESIFLPILVMYFFKYKSVKLIFKRIELRLDLKPALLNVIAMLKLLSIVLFIAHIFANIWIALSKLNPEYNWLHKAEINDKPWYVQYMKAYYFITVTMVTVGYGDITPSNEAETFFAIITIFFACAVFAYSLFYIFQTSVNAIGFILEEINKEKKQLNKKLQVINAYMAKKNVAKELRFQVREYLEFFWKSVDVGSLELERKILGQLGHDLREKLYVEANKLVLEENTFFPSRFSHEVLLKTLRFVKELHFTPEQVIFSRGSPDDQAIFFVENGEIELFIQHGQVSSNNKDGTSSSIKDDVKNQRSIEVKKLNRGAYFGDIEFYTGQERSLSARSVDFSTVLKIERHEFLQVLREFPKDEEIFHMAKDEVVFSCKFGQNGSKCISCDGNDHLLSSCTMVQNVPNRLECINKFNFNPGQKRCQFVRNKRDKYSSLKDIDLLQSAGDRAQDNLKEWMRYLGSDKNDNSSYLSSSQSSSSFSSSSESSSSASSPFSPARNQPVNIRKGTLQGFSLVGSLATVGEHNEDSDGSKTALSSSTTSINPIITATTLNSKQVIMDYQQQPSLKNFDDGLQEESNLNDRNSNIPFKYPFQNNLHSSSSSKQDSIQSFNKLRRLSLGSSLGLNRVVSPFKRRNTQRLDVILENSEKLRKQSTVKDSFLDSYQEFNDKCMPKKQRDSKISRQSIQIPLKQIAGTSSQQIQNENKNHIHQRRYSQRFETSPIEGLFNRNSQTLNQIGQQSARNSSVSTYLNLLNRDKQNSSASKRSQLYYSKLYFPELLHNQEQMSKKINAIYDKLYQLSPIVDSNALLELDSLRDYSFYFPSFNISMVLQKIKSIKKAQQLLRIAKVANVTRSFNNFGTFEQVGSSDDMTKSRITLRSPIRNNRSFLAGSYAIAGSSQRIYSPPNKQSKNESYQQNLQLNLKIEESLELDDETPQN